MLPEMIGGLSPFDQIARTDERGEHWMGRDLQSVMQYARWEDFRRIVERAYQSAKNSGHDADQAFSVVTEEGTGGRPREDFRLTRFAAYLVAMNGDPNKPEVAAAQAYFAIKTREAEVAPARLLPDLTTPEGVLALAEMAAKTARDLIASEAARKEMEPKALAHDAYLAADKGDRLVRQVAKLLGLKEKDLRRFLLDQKIIFYRQAPCGTAQYDVYAAHAQHFKPVEKVVDHTWGACSHYTLYVRPSGVEFIRRRIDAETARHRAALAAASTEGAQ
ncbi:phage antirepressor KilAC domain-containing protein [Glycomyces arizonensis]|uniref:phage antirepressor KilAC domain-containing protein n=1 Tax=Glycomyces arizonensis TaxID=256035 RepID=UPI0004073698|nr:phage antirepressor KilAC domain-containing protein [Glycomyces arizonensis]